MPGSVLEYLSQPNPTVDNAASLPGFPTTATDLPEVVGMRTWTEFTYETMMNLYRHILLHNLPQWPDVSPPLRVREQQVFDEDSLEHFLSRTIVPTVNYALEHTWNALLGEDDSPEISRGGRATKMASDDQRFYPDWAGVYTPIRTAIGLKNLCPGDTKLSTKWSLTRALSEGKSFMLPIQQLQRYCGESWNVRYGYLITQEELVVFRVTRQEIDPGLASTRPERELPQLEHRQQVHQRVVSTTSTDTHMSIDRASAHTRDWSMTSSSMPPVSRLTESYQDDERLNAHFKAIEYRGIPWTNSGKRVLTVKLALWWLHMMAAAPECDTSVQTEYPPLDSWVTSQNMYRHSSTGITAKNLPEGARLISTGDGRSEQYTATQGPSRPGMASEPAQMRTPPSVQEQLPLRQKSSSAAPVGQEVQQEPERVPGKGE